MNPEVSEESQPILGPPPRSPIWGWRDVGLFFGLGLPLIILAQVTLGLIARVLHRSPTSPIVQLTGQGLAYLVLFLVLAMILRVQYDAPFWKSLGWIPTRISPAVSVAAGAALAFTLAIAGGLLRIQNVDSPITKLIEAPHGVTILGVFGLLIAPLAEELAFRGFLQPLMVRSLGVVAGIGLTGAIFGMLHWEQNAKSWGHVALITAAGIAFGALRHLSGSVRTSTWAHIAYNGFFFISLFATGRKISI